MYTYFKKIKAGIHTKNIVFTFLLIIAFVGSFINVNNNNALAETTNEESIAKYINTQNRLLSEKKINLSTYNTRVAAAKNGVDIKALEAASDEAGYGGCNGAEALGITCVTEAIGGIATRITESIAGVVQKVYVTLAQIIYMLASLVAFVGGALLNLSIKLSISNVSAVLPITAIERVWVILRDIANSALVFVLLYSAINTIVGNTSTKIKQLIINVFIIAVAMNFSLFVTKFVVDFSNISGLAIYNRIIQDKSLGISDTQALKGGDFASGDQWTLIIESLKESLTEKGGGVAGAYISALNVSKSVTDPTNSLSQYLNANNEEEAATALAELSSNSPSVLVVRIISNSLMIIFAGMLMAITGLFFLLRVGVIAYLLIMSPIALIAIAVPQLDSVKNLWTKSLYSIFMFPPVFFLLMLVSLHIINGLNMKNIPTGNETEAAALGAVLATTVFTTVVSGFFLTIPLLGASVFSFTGSDWVKNLYLSARNKTAGYVGARTLGKASSLASDSLSKTKYGNTAVGRFINNNTLKQWGNSKYGGNSTIADIEKEDKDIKKKEAQRVAKYEFREKLESLRARKGENTAQTAARNAPVEREIRQFLTDASLEEIKEILDSANAAEKNALYKNMPEGKISAMEKDKDGTYESHVEAINKGKLNVLVKDGGPLKTDFSNDTNTRKSEISAIAKTIKTEEITAGRLAKLNIEDKIALARKAGHVLKGKVYEEITKDMSPSDIERFDIARNEFFVENPSFIESLPPDEVAKLSDKTLKNSGVIQNLTTAMLDKLTGRSREVRKAIAREKTSNTRNEGYDYIMTGPGADFYQNIN